LFRHHHASTVAVRTESNSKATPPAYCESGISSFPSTTNNTTTDTILCSTTNTASHNFPKFQPPVSTTCPVRFSWNRVSTLPTKAEAETWVSFTETFSRRAESACEASSKGPKILIALRGTPPLFDLLENTNKIANMKAVYNAVTTATCYDYYRQKEEEKHEKQKSVGTSW